MNAATKLVAVDVDNDTALGDLTSRLSDEVAARVGDGLPGEQELAESLAAALRSFAAARGVRRVEHAEEAERLVQLGIQQWEKDQPLWQLTMQQGQVHATLAHAAATERVAKAIENLPTYEGMLAVYTFGVNDR